MKSHRHTAPDRIRCRHEIFDPAHKWNIINVMEQIIHPVDILFYNTRRPGVNVVSECVRAPRATILMTLQNWRIILTFSLTLF